MLFERGLELVGSRGLRHLRQRLQDVLLGVVDVLECIQKQLVEVLLGHGDLLCFCCPTILTETKSS